MEFFDSHSHYNDEQFDKDREEIIEATIKNGTTKFTVVGDNVESSKLALEIVKKHKDNTYAICGIHPEYAKLDEKELDKDIKEIEKLIQNDKEKNIVAVGEIGLDYYYGKENKEAQIKTFIKQIDLANKYDMPIVIHTRDAVMDTIETLKIHPENKKGIFHCCPLNRELVKEALKLDFYISFSGIITFKNAQENAKEIVNMVPLEKTLIETDSPYLAPEPFRGKRNNSIYVQEVARKIAEFRNIEIEEVAKITYNNALKIFNKN